MPHKRVGLNLWEHDSTVSVNFCLLVSAMLWLICLLSSCTSGSVGEVAEIIAFYHELLGDVGEVGCHVRNVTCVDVVFCEGVEDFAELGFTHALEGKKLSASVRYLRLTS